LRLFLPLEVGTGIDAVTRLFALYPPVNGGSAPAAA
jgi:hypothetical protein